MNTEIKLPQKEIIGLIPAAGYARRISPIPCSKEIYPMGIYSLKSGNGVQTRVISSYLLESMEIAGVHEVYMVIRKGKWDIPKFYGAGNKYNVKLAYLIVEATAGVPFTINEAYPFMRGKIVVFGFPDIKIEPKNVGLTLLKHFEKSKADIVLSLFKADEPSKTDMVNFDSNNKVTQIDIKPAETTLEYTWLTAVWSEQFTNFMHDYIQNKNKKKKVRDKELFMGDLIQAAANDGLHVEAVTFAEGTYLDIGTAEGLKKAMEID